MKFNINELTIGELREIKEFLNCPAPIAGELIGSTAIKSNESDYPVGKNVIVRTITMIYTGHLRQVTNSDFVLTECSWIPDTDRYMTFVADGKVKECEPYPEDLLVYINRGSLLDMCELKSSLPRSQK